MKTTRNVSKLPFYYLERPSLTKLDREKIFAQIEKESSKIRTVFELANEPKYIYWDKFKYKISTNELSAEEQWFLVKQARSLSAISTSIKAENGEYFKW